MAALEIIKEKADLYFEIKDELEAAKERFKERRIYEVLASEDEHIADLLDCLDALSGENLLSE